VASSSIEEESERSVIERIQGGEFKNIIVLTGAGVSTNAGIPDYRSPKGFFTELTAAFPDATRPELLLTRSFVAKHKVFEHPVYLEHCEVFKDAKPTPSHQFCKWLHDKGWLIRVYTQNIDGLHHKVGLPEDKIVEFHGSLANNTVVLYDDPIPCAVINQVQLDFNRDELDLILVLGTSLKVQPFSSLPSQAPNCSKVLVDSDPKHFVGKQWRLSGPKYHFIVQDTDSWTEAVMKSDKKHKSVEVIA
ncbi:Histone deacetylase, partial [uncultured virus]